MELHDVLPGVTQDNQWTLLCAVSQNQWITEQLGHTVDTSKTQKTAPKQNRDNNHWTVTLKCNRLAEMVISARMLLVTVMHHSSSPLCFIMFPLSLHLLCPRLPVSALLPLSLTPAAHYLLQHIYPGCFSLL